MQLPTPPNNDLHVTPEMPMAREAGPVLPILVACVPFFSKYLEIDGKRWWLLDLSLILAELLDKGDIGSRLPVIPTSLRV
jgi:hypothetical protein